MLLDGELVRVFDGLPAGCGLAGGQQTFAQQDERDHPVRLMRTEQLQLLGRAGVVLRVETGLREIEPGQVVLGELREQSSRFGDPFIAHGGRSLLPSADVESKFYRPGEQRAQKVHDLFATIARRYDLLNDLMSAGLHRHWKNRLVHLAGQPQRVLDLCCGTGDLALRFRCEVVGVDFTAEMLQVARRRAGRHSPRTHERHPDSICRGRLALAATPKLCGAEAARPAQSVTWVRADALQLPFPANSFDVVSIGYGLRNLADLAAGLREVRRVLRPGGKFLSLDFGKPESPAWRRLYFGYLRSTVPVLGRIFCGDRDTHAYILASLAEYPAQRGIRAMMDQAGFVDCGFAEFVGGTMAINFGSKPAA